MIEHGLKPSRTKMLACAHPVPDRRSKPHPNQILKCPRCDSGDTKFCYYNNYSLTQPRYFCKNCKRYWTDGGALRNVPVGGGLRKNKRSKQKAAAQAEATANVPLSSSYDTLIIEKSHFATPTPLSSSDGSPSTPASEDVGNFMRYSNPPPVEQKHIYDPARRVQRVYEAGGQEVAELQRLSYGNHAQQFFPGYSYSLVVGGMPQGYGAYEMNSGTARVRGSNASSEVREEVHQEKQRAAMEGARCSNEAEREREHYTMLESSSRQQPLQGQQDQRLFLHLHELGSMDHESRRGSSSIMEGNFFPLTVTDIKSNNDNGDAGVLHDARSDEVSSNVNNNVNNPYDWQQLISEGLFGATAADFFYTPGGSWPDFDSGVG